MTRFGTTRETPDLPLSLKVVFAALCIGMAALMAGGVQSRRAAETAWLRQCDFIVLAALEKAALALEEHPEAYQGEDDTPLGRGRFSVLTEPDQLHGAYRISVMAVLDDAPHQARVADALLIPYLPPLGGMHVTVTARDTIDPQTWAYHVRN